MSTAAIFNAVKAEQLLAGSDLLTQIEEFRKELRYTTDGIAFSYDDYYTVLQKQISALPHLQLDSEVPSGTESQYQVMLITALEKIYTDIERISLKLSHFQSKIKSAEERSASIKASFVAWYSLALDDYLTQCDKKLPATTIANLASSEFERMMQGVSIELSNIVLAVKVQVEILNKRKKTAQEKFSLGKDQANASWTARLLPADKGTSSDPGAQSLLVTDEEEDYEVPAFVSKQPSIGNEQPQEGETKGFFKVGDAQPVTILPEDDEQPEGFFKVGDAQPVTGVLPGQFTYGSSPSFSTRSPNISKLHTCPPRPEGVPCPLCHPESIPEGKSLVTVLTEFAMSMPIAVEPKQAPPEKPRRFIKRRKPEHLGL
jgi:hypothetical protein